MQPFIKILLLSLALSCGTTAVWAAPLPSKQSIETDMLKSDQFVDRLPLAEVMGPLAPIALSPFFGLTLLSGAAFLEDEGVLPQNDFLSGSEALQNPYVFGGLLLLTVLTSLPRFMKVAKVFAQACDQVETYSSIVAYGVILYFSQFGGVPDSGTELVYTAGIFSFTADTLMMLVVALNIIVINTVKFFFEVCILISPIPLVDAIFEIANKCVVAGLLVVYAFSPVAATVLNLLILLICLILFNWVRRRVTYYRAILAGFVLGGKTIQRELHGRGAKLVPGITGAMVVFPDQVVGEIKKLSHCYLVQGEDGLRLVQPRVLRGPLMETIEASDGAKLENGLLSNRLSFGKQDFIFSRRYNHQLDSIADCFSAERHGTNGALSKDALKGRLKAELGSNERSN